MAIMGSGNDLEIDGIGGGNPLTSKVAIISRSSDPRADVDYRFAEVIVHEQRVDTTPNCGNMLSGVGHSPSKWFDCSDFASYSRTYPQRQYGYVYRS